MDDLGPPSSYLALEPGVSVYSRDGEKLGKVEHVLADKQADIFDGIVLDTSVLPGGHRFADAPQVGEIHERGVVLTLTAAEAETLPEPSENPAVMEDDPSEAGGSPIADKLRRAWDLLSGNY